MTMKSISALLILTFIMTGCSTMKVTSDGDPLYAFGAIQTYQWIDAPTEIIAEEDTYTNDDIKKALGAELKQLAIRPARGSDKADVNVAYYIKLKEEHQYTTPPTRNESEITGGLVYNSDNRKWSLETREPDLNVYAVEIGTLTFLIYDAKIDKQVWRGTLKTKIDRSLPEEKQQERIRDVVKKLMDRFPTKKR